MKTKTSADDPKKLNHIHFILLAVSSEAINIESVDLKSQSPRDIDNMHGGEVSFYDLGISFPVPSGREL